VVTAFLSATATKVSVYVLLRFYFTVFGVEVLFRDHPVDKLLIALSIAAVLTMSLVALFQRDLKRMFAYSSVAQIGYITLGIGLANASGLTGAVAHLFNHGITKGALFLLAGGVALRCGGTDFASLSGLSRRMPLTAFGIVLAGLSLIGIPGTAGFTTKWYLISGALERGSWWLAVLIVVTSLIAVAYVWRFVEVAYLQAPGPDAPRRGEMPLSMLIPALLLVAACIYFGLETSFNIGYARDAVARLLPGAG
jgi:multicomponent Na+:H+ antiporter subunit D